MLFRIIEGNGKAIYFIGVCDNGESRGIELKELLTSIFYLCKIVKLIEANIKKIRIYKGKSGYIATIRINKNYNYDLSC